jgi:hypothetical protein
MESNFHTGTITGATPGGPYTFTNPGEQMPGDEAGGI